MPQIIKIKGRRRRKNHAARITRITPIASEAAREQRRRGAIAERLQATQTAFMQAIADGTLSGDVEVDFSRLRAPVPQTVGDENDENAEQTAAAAAA